MNVLDQLQSNTDASNETALLKYRQILARAAEPLPDDAAELAATMRALGLTAGDVEADLEAMAAYADAGAYLASAEQTAAERRNVAEKRREAETALRALGAEVLERLNLEALVRVLNDLDVRVAQSWWPGRSIVEEIRTHQRTAGNAVVAASQTWRDDREAEMKRTALRREHPRILPSES